MSLRVTGQALRSTASTLTLLGATLLLTGCATLGQSSDPTITNATAQTGGARWGQPMPQVQVADSRFMPPAEIGGGVGGAPSQPPLIDRTTALPPGGGQSAVVSQDLPALQSSPATSAPVTSTPAMSAAQPVVASTPQPMPAPAAPQVTAAPGGTYTHTIASGESLYTIARRYDVAANDIVAANSISSPDRLQVGQRLVIPGRGDLAAQEAPTSAPQQVATTTPQPNNGVQPLSPPDRPQQTAPQVQQPAPQQPTNQVAAAPAQQPTPAAATPAESSSSFRWPLSGRVITDFAASRGTGINIEAPEGTAIRAAERGEVIYVGSAVEGYGNLVLIKHDNGFVSAYAHLRDIGVVKGDMVNRGDSIGTVGMTGSVNRPQLHFELRRGATPVDPIPHLAG